MNKYRYVDEKHDNAIIVDTNNPVDAIWELISYYVATAGDCIDWPVDPEDHHAMNVCLVASDTWCNSSIYQ